MSQADVDRLGLWTRKRASPSGSLSVAVQFTITVSATFTCLNMSSSVLSTVRTYWVPLLLFSTSLVFQLAIVPSSFPPSHYDVLGVQRDSSMEEVSKAYAKLSSSWDSGPVVPNACDFVKIRYAYEILSHQYWRRNYDAFGIEEQLYVLSNFKTHCIGKQYSQIDIPLLEVSLSDNSSSQSIQEKIVEMLERDKPFLVQVFSLQSRSSEQFVVNWKQIVMLLDGIANTGMVELGNFDLSMSLAEKKPTGQHFFRNGIPSLLAFPAGCKASYCIIRYEGELLVDAIADWFTTTILALPHVLYYSKESLVPNFLRKSSPHKVKVILFSKTGERATPFLRHIAQSYQAYASFALVFWREEDSVFWSNALKVYSAPSVVMLKDPGVSPVVHHGLVNKSWFSNFMDQNKLHGLPQLRTATSMEIGCDPYGFSRAGKATKIWYCVVLAGKRGSELDEMRETMRMAQHVLSTWDAEHSDIFFEVPAIALQEKRLSFAWLDGEAQKDFCLAYVDTENSFETCGPKGPSDVPQLFVIRYGRNVSNISDRHINHQSTSHTHVDSASQLVARYKGAKDVQQIIYWISEIVKDGDATTIPFFRTRTPALIPEDTEPIWPRSTRNVEEIVKALEQRRRRIVHRMCDVLIDPRIGPFLLLGALMSFARIWLRRGTHLPSVQNQDRAGRRSHANASMHAQPQSLTDEEPRGACQLQLSGSSDSD